MARNGTGSMRHRLSVVLPSTGRGTRGQRTGTDFVVGSVLGSIETLNGRELELARQRYAAATHRVRTWHPGYPVTPQHYLDFRSRKFRVGHVENVDERDLELVILAAEDK